MTKNELKAKLSLLEDIKRLEAELKEEILSSIEKSHGSALHANLENADECYFMLRNMGYLDKMEDGEVVAIPYIRQDNSFLEIGVTYPDGDKLASHLSRLDTNSFQVGSLYYDKDDYPVDLALAEIRKGELAKQENRPVNNKDIDIYVWSDPFDEDYTRNFLIKNSDIIQALESIEPDI